MIHTVIPPVVRDDTDEWRLFTFAGWAGTEDSDFWGFSKGEITRSRRTRTRRKKRSTRRKIVAGELELGLGLVLGPGLVLEVLEMVPGGTRTRCRA